MLFFYPLDFTFVCPTEITSFSRASAEFREAGCEVLGCSIDSHFVHQKYTQTPLTEGGLGDIDIALLSDLTKSIASDYGVLVDNAYALRGTFIIDKNQMIRHASINDAPVGRSVDEVLRLVKAFQHVDEFGEVCPANWTPGAKTMMGDHSHPLTQEYWQKHHK